VSSVAQGVRPIGRLSTRTLAGALLALASTAFAQSPQAPAEARDVRAWLLRINEAATQRNFQGTFIVSSGGAMASARIAHYCDGRDQVERIESLDGERRQLLRHNDQVRVLWPDSRTVQIVQRDSIASFPAVLQAGDDHIGEYYEMFKQGTDRIAGHEANVLLVKPRDAHRYGYRLWSDTASGLLLRADVLGEQLGVIETSAFSEVSIGVKPQPDAVLQAMKKLDGYRVLRPPMTATQPEAEGWRLQPGVPGFRMVSCVKRPLGRADGDGPDEVLQTIFSDGLTHVSVFIEPYSPRRHARAMSTSVGATQTLMRRQDDWWITVVGDVPPATLRQFAAGLQRKP
jgi:sigma-E factor negative regulatory protein RseB